VEWASALVELPRVDVLDGGDFAGCLIMGIRGRGGGQLALSVRLNSRQMNAVTIPGGCFSA